jgi:hypothetical protein
VEGDLQADRWSCIFNEAVLHTEKRCRISRHLAMHRTNYVIVGVQSSLADLGMSRVERARARLHAFSITNNVPATLGLAPGPFQPPEPRAAAATRPHPSHHHLSSSPLRIFARGDAQAHRECSHFLFLSHLLVGNSPSSCRAIDIAPQLCPRNLAHCIPSYDHASPHFSSYGAARVCSIASPAAIILSYSSSPSPLSLLITLSAVLSLESPSLTRGHYGKQLPTLFVYRLPRTTISWRDCPPERASKRLALRVCEGLGAHCSTPLSYINCATYGS